MDFLFYCGRNPLRSTIEGLPKPLRHDYLYMIEEATFSIDITNPTDPLEKEDTLWRNMKTSLLTTSRNDGQMKVPMYSQRLHADIVRKVNTMNASGMNVPAQEMLIRDVIP